MNMRVRELDGHEFIAAQALVNMHTQEADDKVVDAGRRSKMGDMIRQFSGGDAVADHGGDGVETMNDVPMPAVQDADGDTVMESAATPAGNEAPEPTNLRRSARTRTRPTMPVPQTSSHQASTKPDPAKPDTTGFMPSEPNGFRFEYDSAMGMRPAQLDALLAPPVKPKNDPRDLTNLRSNGITNTFTWLGVMSKKGLSNKLVQDMEAKSVLEMEAKEEAKHAEDVDKTSE